MKKIPLKYYYSMKRILILAFIAAFFTACQKDQIDTPENTNNTNSSTTSTSEESVDYQIKDFIWSGMNEVYLYKADVSELADNFFASQDERKTFYNSYDTPEALFEDLKYSEDRFSFISDDYHDLENSFNGISGSTGMKYGFGRISGTNNYFGFIEYILPGTSAEEAGLERGTVFTEVNGQKLNASNYLDLLSKSSITINIGKVVNGTLEMSDKTVTLTDDPYTANPVYISKTFKIDNHTIGYLMYNSFIGDFDEELNSAFADFKAQGVSDLILDLRYNGGGSVDSAIDLASMITGQFEGKVFMKEQWNEKYQNYFQENDPERLINRFDSTIRTGTAINSLNLNKVYILTTQMTASASELIINGLDPYIDVVQIGDNTTGKYQGSVTIYDSPDFSKKNINPDHTYALQPLVFKSLNAAGRTDYKNGLTPDVKYIEDLENMGTLGDTSEPLLQLAINQITGQSNKSQVLMTQSIENNENFEVIGQGDMDRIDYQKMYIDQLPGLIRE